MPMFLGLLSAMPSLTCALLLIMYHRESVQASGISRNTAQAFASLQNFLTFVGTLFTLSLFTSAIALYFTCEEGADPRSTHPVGRSSNCHNGTFILDVMWIVIIIVWYICQVMLIPRPSTIRALILKYEESDEYKRFYANLKSQVALQRASQSHAPPPGGISPGGMHLNRAAAAVPYAQGSAQAFVETATFDGLPTNNKGFQHRHLDTNQTDTNNLNGNNTTTNTSSSSSSSSSSKTDGSSSSSSAVPTSNDGIQLPSATEEISIDDDQVELTPTVYGRMVHR
eukprot:GHVT01017258.1.p1 GENE.GHVT01017258.1~~GHVT01017258.1.p1  ORF type:complete len:283 (+),score=61.69 GHVT01017258.1:854-1702(+)